MNYGLSCIYAKFDYSKMHRVHTINKQKFSSYCYYTFYSTEFVNISYAIDDDLDKTD